MPLTILHVEDHKIVAEAVRDTLQAEGWRVVTCFTGAEAVSSLASGGRYDVLITDNHLPHINGLELTRYARQLEHRQELPIIMLSGVDCAKAAYQAGVNIFLPKPEGMRQLIEAVRGLTQRQRRGG